MEWSEVSIRTSHEATDVVAEIFHDIGASGVVIEDPALVNDYIQAGAGTIRISLSLSRQKW